MENYIPGGKSRRTILIGAWILNADESLNSAAMRRHMYAVEEGKVNELCSRNWNFP